MSSEDQFDIISEGKANLQVPKGKVFYNEVQRTNRDLSILGIRAWSELYKEKSLGKELKRNKRKRESTGCEAASALANDKSDHEQPFIDIIEALSATGLRAIRYAKEIPQINKVIANDMLPSAVESIRSNATYNEVSDIIIPNEGDANAYMHTRKQQPAHVVDLDPYGSATPFMDAAVQAVKDEGLLLVTCTDLGVLAGNSYPEKCFSYYGGSTLHGDACHESALRLVLNMVASTAAKYGKSIEPLLSLSINFYVRLFIRVKKSPAQVKLNMSKTMIVYHCTGCSAYTCQPLGKATPQEKFAYKYGWATGPTVGEKCSHCGSTHHIAGPMWGGKIHDRAFIRQMQEIHKTMDPEIYKTLKWTEGMLAQAESELEYAPFYVNPNTLVSKVKSSSMPQLTFESALFNAGYKVSNTHCKPGCVKTDAPFEYLWDIIRAWIAKNNDGQPPSNIKANNPASQIVKTLETKTPINFDDHEEALALKAFRNSKVVRFPVHPENWGPKAKPQ